MKKIVHWGKYYYPDTGGIESVTSIFAEGAVRDGYSVSVVCFAQNTPSRREIINGVVIARCPIYKLISSQPQDAARSSLA